MRSCNKNVAACFGSTNKARPKSKTNRTMIDNEYYDWGYQNIFPKATTLIYHALAQFADNEYQTSYPSCEALMKRTGIKNRNQIFVGISQLEKYKIIEVIHSPGRKSNKYKLLSTEQWIKPNNSNINDTVNIRKPSLTVLKNEDEQYQNTYTNSIINDTRTKLNNQTDELKKMSTNYEPKETASYKTLSVNYFEADLERVMNDLYKESQTQPRYSRILAQLDYEVAKGLITKKPNSLNM
jgi:hypothetical protein